MLYGNQENGAKKKMKIGYFGFGKSATRYHLPYVFLRNNLQIKTICYPTKNVERELEYEDKKIIFTQDENVLLDDSEIELVVVCTPPSTHYELAKKSLEHGKHVLVEKPFCTTLAEAEELLQLAADKNLVCIPYQNRRFDSDYLGAQKVLNSGLIGEIIEIESHFDYYRPDVETVQNPQFYNGAFYSLGSHLVDQITSLLGRPDKIVYDIRSVRNPQNPDDTFSVELYYGDTKAIVKTNHLIKVDYPSFTIHGKKGSFVKYGMDMQENHLKQNIAPDVPGFGLDTEEQYGQLVYVDAVGNDVFEIVTSPAGDYGRVYDELYNHIRYKKPLSITPQNVRDAMEVLDHAFDAESPHVVVLKK